MILRRLAVRDFRRFPNFEARFGPGLNVILGNNEEGKSTLREAISLALFVDPRTTKQEVLGLKRWDASEQFSVELEFEADGLSYALVKDFQAKTARLVAVSSGETLRDVKSITARMIELLGLPSQATFESTVRISQREMTRIQHSKEIADRLQEHVTGGEQDVQASRVISDLDKALNALKSTSRSNPGPLFSLPPLVASRQAELSSRERALARAEGDRGRTLELEESLRAVRAEFEEKQSIQKSCAVRVDVEERLKAAEIDEQELEDRLGQIEAEEAAVARAEGTSRQYLALLDVPQDKISEMDWLDRLVNKPTHVETSEPVGSAKEAAGLRKSVVAVGVILVLLGLGGGLLYWPLSALLAVGALVVGWEVVRRLRAASDAATLVAQRGLDEKLAARKEAERRLGEMLGEVGCATVAELHEERETAQRLTRSAERSQARLEAFLSGQTREEVEQARKAASKVVRDLKEKLEEPAMRLAEMDRTSYQRLLRDIADRERRLVQLESEVEDLRVSVRANQIGVDEIHTLEEQIQELKEQLSSAQERQRVLALARQVLDEARTATLVTARDVLQGEIGGLIQEITRGRYSRAVLDANLNIQLIAPEMDEPVSVAPEKDLSVLSTGTVEQVYLAARLALSKLLSQGRRPSLILDDPFVTFDAARTEAVLSLCKRLSDESQVLLFTCREEYTSVADNVVRLPALNGVM